LVIGLDCSFRTFPDTERSCAKPFITPVKKSKISKDLPFICCSFKIFMLQTYMKKITPEKNWDVWLNYVTEQLSAGMNGKIQGRMAKL